MSSFLLCYFLQGTIAGVFFSLSLCGEWFSTQYKKWSCSFQIIARRIFLNEAFWGFLLSMQAIGGVGGWHQERQLLRLGAFSEWSFFFFFAPCLHWLDKPSDWSFTRLLKSTEVGTTHLIFKIFLLLTPPQSSQTNQKDATVTWWHSQNPSSWAPRHHFEGYKAKPCDIWTASKSPPWHAGLLQGEWLLSMLPQQPPPPDELL